MGLLDGLLEVDGDDLRVPLRRLDVRVAEHLLDVAHVRIGNGTVARLEVKRGVPFMVEIEEVTRA